MAHHRLVQCRMGPMSERQAQKLQVGFAHGVCWGACGMGPLSERQAQKLHVGLPTWEVVRALGHDSGVFLLCAY